MLDFDRYSLYRNSDTLDTVPFVGIPKRDTDYFEKYDRMSNRLDLISYKYYNDSSFAWLIMQANPQYGSIEQEIPSGTILRIPYPISSVLRGYVEDMAHNK